MAAKATAKPDYSGLEDADLVERARGGEQGAFRALMKRGNRRLFRVARSVVRDDAEAEDIVQETYMRGFANLDAFRGDANIFTWLTRIALNEANGRLRKRRAMVDLEQVERAQNTGAHIIMFPNADPAATPEADLARTQLRAILEAAIDELPDTFRTVFILREIEECSVLETAAALDIPQETVKTRLHRARRLLRTALNERYVSAVADAYPFLGQRCDRISDAVVAKMEAAGLLAQ